MSISFSSAINAIVFGALEDVLVHLSECAADEVGVLLCSNAMGTLQNLRSGACRRPP